MQVLDEIILSHMCTTFLNSYVSLASPLIFGSILIFSTKVGGTIIVPYVYCASQNLIKHPFVHPLTTV